ncbi:MAG: DUF1850 domain-containing protein [Lachnospiraceae bacterium]|nr:DUF1850 domain-containing protein [Lachnospiraceae bacterium]
MITVVVAAAVILYTGRFGLLTLTDAKTGEVYARYLMHGEEEFSVGFIHSVNKSPVIDHYQPERDGIYVVKTVYYGFGAGVQTLIEEGQTLSYGDDGSMIVTGFDQKIPDLIYFVGTVSDHTLTIADRKEISLRELCGRNSMVRFSYRRLL